MRLGISGHQHLPPEAIEELERTIRALAEPAKLTLVGSLAAGADQIAANAITRLGGQIEVVVPAINYANSFVETAALDVYKELLGQASRVTVLPYPEPTEFAYLAAGILVVERCNRLLAVWDGLPAKGLGGTADVVEYARREGQEVEVIWPEGASR